MMCDVKAILQTILYSLFKGLSSFVLHKPYDSMSMSYNIGDTFSFKHVFTEDLQEGHKHLLPHLVHMSLPDIPVTFTPFIILSPLSLATIF